MSKQEHLAIGGLRKIIAIRASINLGLEDIKKIRVRMNRGRVY